MGKGGQAVGIIKTLDEEVTIVRDFAYHWVLLREEREAVERTNIPRTMRTLRGCRDSTLGPIHLRLEVAC